jgi:hypothetical protein
MDRLDVRLDAAAAAAAILILPISLIFVVQLE